MRPSNSTKKRTKETSHIFLGTKKKKDFPRCVIFSVSGHFYQALPEGLSSYRDISFFCFWPFFSFAENSKMLFRVNNTEEKSMAGQRRWCQIEENQDWKAWRKEKYTLARIHKKIASHSKKNQIRNNVIT